MDNTKIIFAGTPDFAAVHLEALLKKGIRPLAVYTQPDRPKGRGHTLCPSPCKVIAQKEGIPVYTPLNFKREEDIDEFIRLGASLLIVVAYGLILPHRLLTSLSLGAINVHASLLPLYRGAAPIQRALLEGQDTTGVTIMKIADALDAGDVYTYATLKILPTDTSESLFNNLAELGAKTLVDNLPKIIDGSLCATPQDENKVTYAKKITKEESALNFSKDAKTLEREVRGLYPWPVATIRLDDVVYKIFTSSVVTSDSPAQPGTILGCDNRGLLIKTSKDILCIETLQAPGKGRVKACDFCRSKKDVFAVGRILEF